MLEAQGISKKYGQKLVLKDLQFELRPGQFLALLGKNGSGKSTLIRLLAQRDQPNSGKILWNQKNLDDPWLPFSHQVAFVHELQAYRDDLSIAEWIHLLAQSLPGYQAEKALQLIKDLGVKSSEHFASLSRGQKAKMSFALHAGKNPRLYLLDEITSVLDQGSRLVLMNFLKEEISRGAIVVMSTNIAVEMQGYATDVCFLDETKVALWCKPSEFNQLFVKIRTKEKVAAAFRPVLLNSDGSWSFVARRSELSAQGINSELTDRREITISDLATYFTGGTSSL